MTKEPNPKLQLFSNSSLGDHRKCNRYFYWSQRRRWVGTGRNIAANFGSCWGKAQDILWIAVKEGHPDDVVIELAYDAFVHEWREEYEYPLLNDMTDDEVNEFKFRHEQTAAAMLQNYVPTRRAFIERVDLLTTEKPFAVPISPTNPDVFYVGKIDKVIRWDNRIWGVDHKTTSWYRKAGGFSPEWLDDWHMRSQLKGYVHALKMEYGKEAKGALIDAALVHKTVNDAFQFIPIDIYEPHLDSWLWEVFHEITLIEANDRNLEQHRTTDDDGYDFMPAFPKNDNSCISYMKKCTFWDLCHSDADPEAIKEPPEGFQLRTYEMFDKEKLKALGLPV